MNPTALHKTNINAGDMLLLVSLMTSVGLHLLHDLFSVQKQQYDPMIIIQQHLDLFLEVVKAV